MQSSPGLFAPPAWLHNSDFLHAQASAVKMLNLQSQTSERWLQQVDEHLELILIDHAHCENKAARAALNLMIAYVENNSLCKAMTQIVQEELEHFHRVRELLERRGIHFRRLQPSRYGGQLNQLIRKFEPERAVDRLLIAGLIEARSCERFDLLRRHVADPELSDFYDSLFASEAGHHATYVRLARDFASSETVDERLVQLAVEEARIISEGDEKPRMHS